MTIADIPTDWLEHCLAAMDSDPVSRDDQGGSIGRPCGMRRPELGAGIQDLACACCGATWAGIPGDPCWWCQQHIEIQLDHQAELLLQAPDADPDDETYGARMAGWADRLVTGIQAGIIDQRQAETAWARTVRRAA